MSVTIKNTLLREMQGLQGTTPHLDTEVLLAYVLKRDRSWLAAHADDQLPEKDALAFAMLCKRRSQGVPVAYLTGTQEFYGRSFHVNNNVLVPRPESESFIEVIKKLVLTEKIHSVLDMGTGSGCLAITTKLEIARLYVMATDISKNALKIAAKNALLLNAAVTFKHQSLLIGDKERYDVILANLPYVPENLKHPSTKHEPQEALYSGSDGLTHYRQLFSQLTEKCIPFVITESLVDQHVAMLHIARDASYECVITDGLVQVFRNKKDITILH